GCRWPSRTRSCAPACRSGWRSSARPGRAPWCSRGMPSVSRRTAPWWSATARPDRARCASRDVRPWTASWTRASRKATVSGLDKAWPRFASRRGRVLAAGAGAVAVLALAGLRGSADVARPVAVKRQDLVQTVEVEGELQAVRSTEVGVPPVRDAEFKIAFLIPEGTAVKKGQPVLGFDTEAL